VVSDVSEELTVSFFRFKFRQISKKKNSAADKTNSSNREMRSAEDGVENIISSRKIVVHVCAHNY
jgi:hypothetical protein